MFGDNKKLPAQRAGYTKLWHAFRDMYPDFHRAAKLAAHAIQREKAYKETFINLAEPLQYYIGYKHTGVSYTKFADRIKAILAQPQVLSPFAESAMASPEPAPEMGSPREVLAAYKKLVSVYDSKYNDYEFVINGLRFLFHSGQTVPSCSQIRSVLVKVGVYVMFNNDFNIGTGPPKKGFFERLPKDSADTPRLPGFFVINAVGALDLYNGMRGREPERSEENEHNTNTYIR